MQSPLSGPRSVSGEAAWYQCCLHSGGPLFLQANGCEVPRVPSPMELEATQIRARFRPAGVRRHLLARLAGACCFHSERVELARDLGVSRNTPTISGS